MSRHALRIGLVIVASVIVLVIGAAAAFVLSFNPNDLKPRIIAAVKEATGRDLVLKGDVGLKLSLRPTLEVSGVSLSNAPGFAPPEMATIERLDLQLAVLPLLRHRVEINRLILIQPAVHLQTNAQGKSNWEFNPRVGSPPAAQAHASRPSAQTRIGIASVQIINGTITYRDDRTGRTRTLKIEQYTSTSASPHAPLHVNLDAEYDGASFNLSGVVGPLAHLLDPSSTTPWPVKVTLAAAGARLNVNGTLTRPLQGRGYALTVQGSVANLARLGTLLSARHLPPLQDLNFSTRIADTGKPVPQISDLTLHVGPSDLSGVVAGLKIDQLAINAPVADQPIQMSAQGTFAGGPLRLAATLGPLAALTAGPFPLDVKGQVADGNFEVKGAIANPQTLTGVGLGIDAQMPDLATLTPLAGRALPAIKSVALHAELNDATGGIRRGVMLRNIKLTTAAGDLSGDAAVMLTRPPTVTAQLASARIDADALMGAAGKPVQITRPPHAARPEKQAQAGAPPPGKPAHGGAPPPAKPSSAGGLFSDKPLPFGLLRTANADVTLSLQDLHSGDTDYRAVTLHAVLRDGRLTVSPVSADLPGGPMIGMLRVDASGASPSIAVTVTAPGVEVGPLLSAAGLPGYASGKLEVRADLHGAGTSVRAIAAGLNGPVDLAMAGGTVDAALLNDLLADVLAKADLLGLIAHGGSTELRCFATRAVVRSGVATVDPLLLSTTAMTVLGSGTVNLGAGTLDMTMRPQGRIGGTGLVVPVQVTGPIRSPRAEVNALGAVQSNARAVARGVLGHVGSLGALGRALLGRNAGGGESAAAPLSCADALRLARGGTPPAAPAPAATKTRPKPPNAAALLRQLFH